MAAVFKAVGRDERILAQIALQDHPVLVNDRRTAETPFVLGEHNEAGIERAQVALPQELAFKVVTIESFRAETSDHVPAVRRRGAVGLAPLEMPLELWHALKRGAL